MIPVSFVLVVAAVLFFVARLPAASAQEHSHLASQFHFTEQAIALPPGLPEHTIRAVNPQYKQIQAWISSVGAGIAINDLSGTGHPNDICLVDTRSNSVVVTPTPDSGARYAPFVLEPAPLPYDDSMAPMGCAPGDFNGDGRMDLLVYYWGRTPVVFLGHPGATSLSPSAYTPTELVPQQAKADGRYHGLKWNTNAVNIADFDGDGHADIGIFNYFPDSDVLKADGLPNVQMNHSMSGAHNGGGAHILRWASATSGDGASVSYEEQPDAIPLADATGWTLGAASADLDGDLLPELYVANDFGHDHLFHNVSTPGNIKFLTVKGQRTPTTPKSMVLGNDSFKGMSVDFGDLYGHGSFDMFVSNITTAWGLEESNFVWTNTAKTNAEAKKALDNGIAPYVNDAANLNMAWIGWGWDTKMADFNNSGQMSVIQTTGFVKGDINRWSWLQELAMSNDMMLQYPEMWPKAGTGDDIAGRQALAVWVPEGNGRFVNLSHDLGMDAPIPTRGVAVADATGTGAQDFAVARQWGPPVYYHNNGADQGTFLGLRLYRPATPGSDTPGTPAYGAVVKVTTADGRTRVAQLDGGSGHSGKRSFDVFFGLGPAGEKPITAQLSWRDLHGAVHTQQLDLSHGWHNFMLDTTAQEVTAP